MKPEELTAAHRGVLQDVYFARNRRKAIDTLKKRGKKRALSELLKAGYLECDETDTWYVVLTAKGRQAYL